MRNKWLFTGMDEDSSTLCPVDPLFPHTFRGHFFSRLTSFLDNSHYWHASGTSAFVEALDCISKYTGSLYLRFASGSNSSINRSMTNRSHASTNFHSSISNNIKHIVTSRNYVMGFFGRGKIRGKSPILVIFDKIPRFALKLLRKEAEHLQSLPALCLAALLVPPLNNVSPDVLAVSLKAVPSLSQSSTDGKPCAVQGRLFGDLAVENFSRSRHKVEPKTGIEFPTILREVEANEDISSCAREVLVGTGSRTMKIIKIKTLKVYAFGVYIHPSDVCIKLRGKYGSVPVDGLNNHSDLYTDLLREDINMTVRLVVSCNGIKINTVRDAFEKSLRARLLKANPGTDFHCLEKFGSFFVADIPLQVGTTINFRRTADWHFITEIGGSRIGSVHSKDLCRAFFDMYVGDFPVSQQTKEEIGKNVVNIMSRC
ncbi:hypothetical protein Leryth_000556 [Lithospermum erythrorhizon]|nr:hypothetical protein Leryth_000556 [Lithospermum erythrorhizon]